MASSADGKNLAAVDRGGSVGGYVYTSDNFGALWVQRAGSGARGWSSIGSSMTGKKLIAANGTGDGGLFFSEDFGITWNSPSWSTGTWQNLAVTPGADLFFAINSGRGTGGAFYVAPKFDNGISQPTSKGVYQGTDRTNAFVASASSSDGGLLIAIVAPDVERTGDLTKGYLFTSTDQGSNWVGQTTAGNRVWRAVAASADGRWIIAADYGDVALSGSPGMIYGSSNYGSTWRVLAAAGTRRWVAVASSSDGKRLVAAEIGNDGTGGNIYTSADYGDSWKMQADPGAQRWSSVATSSDGSRVVATASDAGIWTGEFK